MLTVSFAAKIPKPKVEGEEGGEDGVALPQTLVRIPIHQAEAAQKDADALSSIPNPAVDDPT